MNVFNAHRADLTRRRWRPESSLCSGAAVLGLLVVAVLVPAGPVTIQNSGWRLFRALAALVPASPAQAQSTIVVLRVLDTGNALLARWFPVAGASHYSVEAFAGSSTTAAASATNITSNSHTLSGLTGGTAYRVVVKRPPRRCCRR